MVSRPRINTEYVFKDIPRGKNGRPKFKQFRVCPCGRKFMLTHQLQLSCHQCREERKLKAEKRAREKTNGKKKNG